MMAAMTLMEFLTARLDEDEATASRTGIRIPSGTPNPYYDATMCSEAVEPEVRVELHGRDVTEEYREWGRQFKVPINLRMLADVATKRRIVEFHTGRHECPGDDGYAWYGDEEAPYCQTLRLLAKPYADHNDWCEEWGAGT
jgi:hypothetical protein